MHERDILYFPLGVGIFHFQILQIHVFRKTENTKSTAFVSKMQEKFERRFKVFGPLLWKTFFFFQLWKEQIQKSSIRTFFMVLLNSLLHALLRYWPTYNALISSEINTFRSQGFRHEFRAMLGLQRSEGESRSGLPMVNPRSYNSHVSFLYEIKII